MSRLLALDRAVQDRPSAPEQGSDGTDRLALLEMQPCRLGPLIVA
jgi:hypothetical protein